MTNIIDIEHSHLMMHMLACDNASAYSKFAHDCDIVYGE